MFKRIRLPLSTILYSFFFTKRQRMETLHASQQLLREHMLFVEGGATNFDSENWQDLPITTSPLLRHIDNYRRSAELTADVSISIVHAATRLIRSPSVVAPPSLGVLELSSIFTNHMNIVFPNNEIPGRYILQALCLFFRCDKMEAFIRYASPLINPFGVLKNASSSRPSCKSMRLSVLDIVRCFEDSRFSASPVTSIGYRMCTTESLVRYVSLLCFQTKHEGCPEVLYESHNPSIFASPGEHFTVSSIRRGPDMLNRYWLGSSWFFGQSTVFPATSATQSQDHCAIVSTDEVQTAIFQLCSANNPGTLSDRSFSPVFATVGFAAHVPQTSIRHGVKFILDSIEGVFGSRDLLPYSGSENDATQFRQKCANVGQIILETMSILFCRTENGCGDQVPRLLRSCHHSPLGVLNASQLSQIVSSGYGKRNCAYPQLSPFFEGFCVAPILHSPPSCKNIVSMNRVLLLAHELAFTSKTKCLTSAIFYNNYCLISDTHPYVSSILWMSASAAARRNGKSRHSSSFAAEICLTKGTFAPEGCTTSEKTLERHTHQHTRTLSMLGSDRSSGHPQRGSVTAVSRHTLCEVYVSELSAQMSGLPVGWSTALLLSHAGLDLLIVVPRCDNNLDYSRFQPALETFSSSIAEEMRSLSHNMTKLDVTKKVSHPTKGKQKRPNETLCYVYEKSSASVVMMEMTSDGSSIPLAAEPENSGSSLTRSTLFISESQPVSHLLGCFMHQKPKRYFAQSLASKPISRVLLGRSAFGENGDRPGVFTNICGRNVAGNNLVVGSSAPTSLRSIEDIAIQFVASCSKSGHFSL